MEVDKILWILATISMLLAAVGISINANSSPNPDGTGGIRLGINFFNLAWVFVFLTFLV